MIINYNPIQGSGPLRISFKNVDLLKITATESKEENGVYWLEDGKLLAVEFDEVSATGKMISMTIKETGQIVSVVVNENGISVTSPSFGSLAG